MIITDDPAIITEADVDFRERDLWGDPLTDDDLMTYDEWWSEFDANACCADNLVAARNWCACGGSARIPSGISRLLFDPEELW